MGFDFFIHVRLHICEETGKPFYYGTSFEKKYDVESIRVPEAHRRFVQLRGWHLKQYVESCTNECQAEIEELVDAFPEWEDSEDNWSRDDHEAFLEALNWFVNQRAVFYASWSY
jgi:hypothetical protein